MIKLPIKRHALRIVDPAREDWRRRAANDLRERGIRPPADATLADIYAIQSMSGVRLSDELANRIFARVRGFGDEARAAHAYLWFLSHPLVDPSHPPEIERPHAI
jgi:hypothetical protein